MPNLAAGFLLLLGVVAPLFARGDSATPARPSLTRAAGSGEWVQELLKHLDLGLAAKAYAAECRDEDELCKTTAECCPGLECSGEPQPTCRPQE